MSSLARKKRNFIILSLIIPTLLLICFVVLPAFDLFRMSLSLIHIFGCTLPIIAQILHLDPAIMAAPLITTIVDAVSLVVYLQLACSLLSI